MSNSLKSNTLTYLLIGINVIVYLFTAYLSKDALDMDMQVLADMGALYAPYVVYNSEWWRLFTAIFLHSGITHLAMNMISLYIIGKGMEVYFSRYSYLAIYFTSGILGGVASLYMHPDSLGVGASGAIFGIFGALAGFFLAYRDQITAQSKAFMKDFAIMIGINLAIGFSIPSVDVTAHMAGLLVGFIGGFMLSKNHKLIFLYSTFCMAILIVSSQYILS